MNGLPTKSSLPAGRKQLVETMQRINFGRIEGLDIRNGEPTFSSTTRIIQDIKLGGAENGHGRNSGRRTSCCGLALSSYSMNWNA